MDYKELIDKLREDALYHKNCSNEPKAKYFEVIATAIETLLEERESAIKLLRKINWCSGCAHFMGLKGCADNDMDVCCNEDDHYQFCGPTTTDRERTER